MTEHRDRTGQHGHADGGAPTSRVPLDVAVTAVVAAPGSGAAFVGTTDGRVLHVPVHGPATEAGSAHATAVVALAADPHTGVVAAGDRHGRVVLTAPDGAEVTVELGSRVRALAWSGDGHRLAALSQVAGLVVLDPGGDRVAALAPSRRWRTLAWHGWNATAPLVVGGAGGITWIDPDRDDPVVRRDRSPGAVLALAVDPVGPWVAAGDLRGEVRLIDGRDHHEIEVSGWPEAVKCLAWLPGRGCLAVAGGDEVTVWWAGPSEGEHPDPERCALDGRRITGLAAHPTDPLIAIGADDGTVVAWDVETGAVVALASFSGPSPGSQVGLRGAGAVSGLVWDADGEHVLVGTRTAAGWCRRPTETC